MFRDGLTTIETAAARAGREKQPFGTGHLLFTCLADSYEEALDAATKVLSHRYAMDFRRAAERYAALGQPEQVASRIREFHAAGARHIVLDIVGPYEKRSEQVAWFARDVLPRLADLR
jgi:alkanesulfonate monooxygenase SsuD/methylene tetrahydromethanopterin reductase-like flavin-dependent oxidoreductase (luciferase family)